MTDDRVIDIRRYLNHSGDVEGQGTFAVWGGDGERSRFALPIRIGMGGRPAMAWVRFLTSFWT